MSLFRKQPRPFSTLSDLELQEELVKAEASLEAAKEKRKMARMIETRFLQFALEAERRIHLIECHGRTDETLDKMKESRDKFWKSYEESVLQNDHYNT